MFFFICDIFIDLQKSFDTSIKTFLLLSLSIIVFVDKQITAYNLFVLSFFFLLLFVYINNLQRAFSKSIIHNFADDT